MSTRSTPSLAISDSVRRKPCGPSVETAFLKKVAESGAVLECHHVTGAWNYLIKVRLKNTRELERFLAQELKSIDGMMRTETLIVLSSAKEVSTLEV